MPEYVFHFYPRWVEGPDGAVVVHNEGDEAQARGLMLSDEAVQAIKERVQALSDAINAQHHSQRAKAADEARSAFESLFADSGDTGETTGETPRRRGRPPKVREV